MLGKVMVIGDMNGRTNEVKDYIVNDFIDSYLPTPDDYYPDNKLKRRQNYGQKHPQRSKVTEDQFLNTVAQLVYESVMDVSGMTKILGNLLA